MVHYLSPQNTFVSGKVMRVVSKNDGEHLCQQPDLVQLVGRIDGW